MGQTSIHLVALALVVMLRVFVKGQIPMFGTSSIYPSLTSITSNPGTTSSGSSSSIAPGSFSSSPIGSDSHSYSTLGGSSFSPTDYGSPSSSSTSSSSSNGFGGSSVSYTGSGPPSSRFFGSSRYIPHSRRSSMISKFQVKPSGDPLNGTKIVCIFNNKKYFTSGFSPSMIDASLCTHINYEFAILDPKTFQIITGEPDIDIHQNCYDEATALKKLNPKLKVMISLGGWEDSTKKYSELAADPEKRKKFIENAIIFIKDHEFDGLDFAWEYPNCWQGAIGINPSDKKNFATLLQEMKSEFDKKNFLLSVSVGAIKREIDAAYDVPEISKAVSHINVMTYDMHGPWEPKTGHHTQFEKMEGDSDPYCNVKAALDEWVKKGADKKKVLMGIAFYAKTFTLADPTNWKLGAPANGVGNPGNVSNNAGFLLYNEMCQNLNSGDWSEDEEKGVGYYAHCGDQWACYDSPMMVVKKAKHIIEEGRGGVLLKDMSGDDYKGNCFSMAFPLTKMIRLEMISVIKKMLHTHKV